MPDPSALPRRFAGWRILGLATLTLGLTGPGQTIGVSVFVDHFSTDLDLKDSWITAGYLVGTLCGSAALPSVGRWIDRFGVRRSMTVIAAGFSVALAAMAGVQGIISLTAGFVFIRMLGQGSLSLVSTVAVSLWFERRRGLALGIAVTVSSGLMALVPVALNAVIGEIGWRGAWLIAAGTVAVVVLPIAWFGMIDTPADIGQNPDGAPNTAAIDALVDEGYDRSAAVATRAFWILAAAVAAMSMLGTALNFHQVALLGESGLSSSEAAAMFLPQVVGASIGAPVTGFALDRVGSRYAPAAVLGLLALVLVLAGTTSSTSGIILYAIALGLAGGSSRTLGAALIPKWFGTAHIGSIQGALTFIGVMASALGPFAFSVTESATGDYRSTALLWAAVPAIAATAAFASHKSIAGMGQTAHKT